MYTNSRAEPYNYITHSTHYQKSIQPPSFQPRNLNLYTKGQRVNERQKYSKENTNNNYATGRYKQGTKKTIINTGFQNKDPYRKHQQSIKLMPAKIHRGLPISSKQKYQRSSRPKIQGSQSHSRIILKNNEIIGQRHRQRQPTQQSYAQTINYAPMTRQYQFHMKTRFQIQPSVQHQNKTKSRLQIQYKKPEPLVKSRVVYSQSNEQKVYETKVYESKVYEAKQEWKAFKKSTKRFMKQQTISELQCQEDFSMERRSARKSRVRKSEVKIQEPQPVILSPQQLIKKFEQQQAQVQTQFDSECIQMMINREAEYYSLPHFSNYLDIRQKHINWIKRAVLVNWMMEFMVDHDQKRQTLNIAVSIVDRYLCSISHCPLNRLQLIGVTALFIAVKLQQSYRPHVSSFAECTSESFTQQDIMQQQISILQCLKYQINSPTLNSWCLRLTIQWDLFIKTSTDEFVTKHNQLITFKNSDQKSYYNYRWLVQLLDFALLDIHTLRFQSRTLVTSFMYLVLGLRTQQFKQTQVVQQFSNCSTFAKQSNNIILNQTFNKFLKYTFNMQLWDLVPMIQYCSTFFILPLTFELPEKAKQQGKQIGYEQFCSYQTVNKHNIYCLQKRYRDCD